jgi:hypothetical protein
LAFVDNVPLEAELEDEPQPSKDENLDEMMADAIARQEESEMDAMISSYLESSQTGAVPAPVSPKSSLSDDEDYDQLFMDIVLSQEAGESVVSCQQMDVS